MRRAFTVTSVVAVIVSGAKVLSDHSAPGTGFSTLATVAAEPTGPTGPGGGPGDFGGQFVPPPVPSIPGYDGGRGYPGPDQNAGINIYNTPTQAAPEQGRQPGQNADGAWQRARNGEQNPPNYSTAPAYTQGQSIPNTAPPQSQQQATPTQPTHSQQPTQTQQPSQSPTQTSSPNRESKQDQDRDCQFISGLSSAVDGKVTYTATPEVAQQVANAAKKWNDLGGIQIAPASSSGSSNDDDDRDNTSDDESESPVTLRISTINDPKVPWGGRHTHGDGSSPAEIVINLARMQNAGPGGVESVLGHELGHDLGLADSVAGQLMAPSGPLPEGPQALDADLLRQISSEGATQQCFSQNMSKAMEEYFDWGCPFGRNDSGGCNGAGVARGVGNFFSGAAGMVWEDIKGLWDAITILSKAAVNYDDGISRSALRRALGPLVGLGPDGSPGFFDAWGQFFHETGNQLIGWDDWFAGNYMKAGERVAATAFELAVTLGAPGAAAKLIKLMSSAVRKVADLLKRFREAKLTTKEIDAIADYTDEAYDALNLALRTEQNLSPDQQALAKELSSALTKLPDFKGVVYRGFSASRKEILERYQPGKIVIEKGFTSTDLDKAFDGNIFMTITSSTGKEIAKYSLNAPNEAEVLFNQGTKFLVDDIKEVGTQGVAIVMHEVP